MEQPNAMSQYPSVDYYSALLQHSGDSAVSESFSVPIGTKTDGTMVFADLEQLTHLLICGYSGTGKTSFVQAIILWLAHAHSREQVQFVLFDSKGVDYASLQSLPHLYCPVVTTESKALSIISLLAEESEARCKLFQQTHCQDILSFHKQFGQRKMIPQIYIVLDDFSSLMLYNKYNVPASLLTILQNGRTVGIHLILITSLTNTKTLSKSILTNIPYRISFGVSSRADSRLAIDKEGAEILRSPGELMFKGQDPLQKCQGAYLSEAHMRNVLKKIKRDRLLQINTLGDMAEQIFKEVLIHNKQESSQSSSEDQLIRMVMDRCVELGQVSTTAIQRQLKIGYAKAARILDQMENLGLIGPSEGAKPRRLLISPTQWASMRNHNYVLSPKPPSFASESSTGFSIADNAHAESQGSPDIILRDFEEFTVENVRLSVHDNRVFIRKQIMTPYGKGYANPNFDGKSIARLIYKKPHLLSRGHIQFVIKAASKLTNNNPEIKSYEREDLADLLTVQFRTSDAKTVNAFMKQISEDIGIALTVL